MTQIAHVLRDMLPSDRRLIGDSWSKTLLGASESNPRGVGPLAAMRRGRYFEAQDALIERILAAPGTVVTVAASPEAVGHVLGWVCGAPGLRMLHFLYVSHSFRRFGLASTLIRSVFGAVGVDPIAATQWTRVLPCYFEKWRLEYDPFALFDVVAR